MKITNGQLFNIKNVLFRPESFMYNGDITQIMAVRNALKFNVEELQKADQVLQSLIQDILKELQNEYVAANKATKEDDNFKIKTGYEEDFNKDFQGKLDELAVQEVELNNFQTYSKEKFDLFMEKNDGLLKEADIRILEMFIKQE